MDDGAPPAAKDAAGVHTNTADVDCAHCNADLWLSAVVSPAAPGVAVCPEHAEVGWRETGAAAPADMRCPTQHPARGR